MSFTEALPPRAKGDGSGVSVSLRSIRKTVECRLTFNEKAQKDLFGGSIEGRKAKAMIGRNEDEGKLRIVLDDDGFLVFKGSMRGSVQLAIRHWDLLPETPRKAEAASIIGEADPDAGAVTLRLPSWSKPNGAGGRAWDEAASRPPPRKPEPGELVGKKPIPIAAAGAAMEKAVGR